VITTITTTVVRNENKGATRLVTGLRRTLKSLHWLPIQQLVTYKLAILVHKCINGRAP